MFYKQGLRPPSYVHPVDILLSLLINLLLEVTPLVSPHSSEVSRETDKKRLPPNLSASTFPGIPLSGKEFLCEERNLSLGISVQVFLSGVRDGQAVCLPGGPGRAN